MRSRGFTLVEVMVALAVVAIALPALLTALYRQVDDTAYLRDRTLAEMVAANKLAEIRLVTAATRALAAGRESGSDSLWDRDWYWWVETQSTDIDLFYRVEIAVALAEEHRETPLYTLNAFLSADLAVDADGLQRMDGEGGEGGQGGQGGQGGEGGFDPQTGMPQEFIPDDQ